MMKQTPQLDTGWFLAPSDKLAVWVPFLCPYTHQTVEIDATFQVKKLQVSRAFDHIYSTYKKCP